MKSTTIQSTLNEEKLKEFANALIAYEFINHDVDLHNELEHSSLRIIDDEGYKYLLKDYWTRKKNEESTYIEKIFDAIGTWNLADIRQKANIETKLLKNDPERFEASLHMLFDEKKEKEAFNEIVSVIGQLFDVLGLIFFLYDPERFMPIRSDRFDENFALIDLQSGLSHHCSWEVYQQYNDWMREIQIFLKGYINPKITLIDAHSFVWLLCYLVKFKDEKVSYLKYKKQGNDNAYRWCSCYITDITDKYVRIRVEEEKKDRKFEIQTLYDTKRFHFFRVDIYTGEVFFDKVAPEVQVFNDEQDEILSLALSDGEFPEKTEVSYKPGIVPPSIEKSDSGHKYYRRDPQVARNALALAGFVCEVDPSHKTFKRKKSDINYTEAHHIVPMAYQNYFEKASLDREQNIVSLCSHCHNLIHYGRNGDELVRVLYHKRKDLLKSVGIDISIEQLVSLYE